MRIFSEADIATVAYNCQGMKRKHTSTRCKFRQGPATNQPLQNDLPQIQT